MKKVRLIGISMLAILVIITSIFAYNIYFKKLDIGELKTVVPSVEFSKNVEPDQIIRQMMKDMYPGEKLYGKDDEEYLQCAKRKERCLEIWYYVGGRLEINPRNYRENNFSKAIDEGVQIFIRRWDSLEMAQKYKKENDGLVYQFPEKDQILGVEYYFCEVNGLYTIESPFAGIKQSRTEAPLPWGYKHNKPFLEYFRNIKFVD